MEKITERIDSFLSETLGLGGWNLGKDPELNFALLKDGKAIWKGASENDALMFLQKTQSQSADYALKHGGYKIVPLKEVETFTNEEVIDMAAGVESLRKIVASGKEAVLKWSDGQVETNPLVAKFLLKVYDLLDIKGKAGFEAKLKSKKGFMNLSYVAKGVTFGESEEAVEVAVELFEAEMMNEGLGNKKVRPGLRVRIGQKNSSETGVITDIRSNGKVDVEDTEGRTLSFDPDELYPYEE